jgi:hypothetical protein
MVPHSEQINLDEMDAGFRCLSLLATIEKATRAILLICRTKKLDPGNQSVGRRFEYFEKDFLDLDSRSLNVNRLIGTGAVACRCSPGSLSKCSPDCKVWHPSRFCQPNPFADINVVPTLAKAGLKLRGSIHDEYLVESRPDRRMFKPWVHSWKGTRHVASSTRKRQFSIYL